MNGFQQLLVNRWFLMIAGIPWGGVLEMVLYLH